MCEITAFLNSFKCLLQCVLMPVIVLSGIVGEVDKDAKAFYMWTHKKLDIGYNRDAIVDVNLTSEAKVKLEPGAQISFTYEVRLSTYTVIDGVWFVCSVELCIIHILQWEGLNAKL